jgi:hypothetical protein
MTPSPAIYGPQIGDLAAPYCDEKDTTATNSGNCELVKEKMPTGKPAKVSWWLKAIL